MSSQQVIPPHIAPDADGTFDSHYYAKAAADALLAAKANQSDLGAKADQSYVDAQDATKQDVASLGTAVANTAAVKRVDPGTAGALGQSVTIGPSGPAWLDGPVLNAKHPRFDAKGDGTTDDTAAIQAAINAAVAAGGGQVLLPRGIYLVSSLTLKTSVQLCGVNMGATVIKAKAGATDPGLIVVDQSGGAVKQLGLFDLTLNANGNANQWGLYFNGVASPDGGIWYANFERMRINDFVPGGINLRGGPNSFLIPHQFMRFHGISCITRAGANTTWVGLRVSGQVGQVTFDQCEWTGDTTNRDRANAVYLSRYVDNTGTITGDDTHPYALTFTACTFQGTTLGARIDRAEAVTFTACWFEDNKSGFLVEQNGGPVLFLACNFNDTGSDGSGTGYIGQTTGQSKAYVVGGAINGTADRTWVMGGGVGYLRPLGVQNAGSIVGEPRQLTAAATLNIGYDLYALVTGSTAISAISHNLGKDDVFSVRAVTDLTFNQNSSLRLGTYGPTFILPAGHIAHFKVDKSLNFCYLVGTNAPGTLKRRVTTATSTATLGPESDTVLASAAGGAITLTLPAASAANMAGRMVTIKKTDSSANAVTVSRAGSETIDGATTYALSTQYQFVSLVSDGANWLVVAKG